MTRRIAVVVQRQSGVAQARQMVGELIHQRPQWPRIKVPNRRRGEMLELGMDVLLDEICIEEDCSYTERTASHIAAVLHAGPELCITGHFA